jgi:hypothetical protein
MDISNILQIYVIAVPSKPWTTISDDDEFISHLIQLYFTWETPVYDLVQEDVFIADMKSGNENSPYCSSLLVNAMLAIACVSTDVSSLT